MADYVSILGTAYAVPANLRGNKDPVFDWLNENVPEGTKLFEGYKTRPVLAPNEALMDILVPASIKALNAAGIATHQVDALIGQVSVSEFLTPNGLARLHGELNLPATAWVLPINNEFNNFSAGLLLADTLVRAKRARNVLVVCGGNWTRYVDYHTAQSVSAADGAGAAVVGRTADPSLFRVMDSEVLIRSEEYGVMFMQADAVAPAPPSMPDGIPAQAYTQPYFHITEAGLNIFPLFGEQEPPEAVARLLKRNGLSSRQVALISHQASSVLIDAWKQAIQPGQYLESLGQFANMTVATLPVNLAYFYDQITLDNVVLLGLGTELQVVALLLQRGS